MNTMSYFVLLCMLSLLATCQAKIHHSKINKDERSLIPLSDAFGFSEGGKIDITIRDISVYQLKVKPQNFTWDSFGFFLSPVEADATLEQDVADDSRCLLNEVNDLFNFSSNSLQQVISGNISHYTYRYKVSSGGLFYLYFANCALNTPISFDCVVSMYNTDSKGKKDFLSVGETQLVFMYWVAFALFAGCACAWASLIRRHRSKMHEIHILMLVLVVFKALTLLSQALMYHFIERSGRADGWNIAFYVFTFFRGILFFTVVVLIGNGWSYMRPFLGDREKRIIMIVLPLQIIANAAIIITEEESPALADWFTWRDVLHLVDLVCCCAILFPIVWSIRHLREAAEASDKAAKSLETLTIFRQFYIMVVVYIYFTRIVVYLLRNTLEYEYTWVSEAASQGATLAFYVWTASKFRPNLTNNPYLKLEQNDVELSERL